VSLALANQHATRMSHILSSAVFWLYLIFPRYLINDTINVKRVIKHKMGVSIFSTTFSEIFLILKNLSDIFS
jgi:hypothetical protein